MDRGTGDVQVGDFLVEEPDQEPHQPAFGLPFLAQEEHVVPGDDRHVDLRNHRVAIAENPREKLVAATQHPHEVVVDLAFDGLGDPARLAEVPKVGRPDLR